MQPAATAVVTKSDNELDILGRQASAHIRAALKHQEKGGNHAKSAAMCLYEVQQAGIVGKAFEAFCEKYDIRPRTGYQLVQEFANPEKKVQRQQAQREHKEATRRAEGVPARFSQSSDINDLAPPPSPNGALVADTHGMRLAAALRKARHHMSRENQLRVIEFIETI